MNVGKPKRASTRASTNYNILWNGLNWPEIEQTVNKLQSRIAKAVERGRYNLVKKLQYLLTNSFTAKLLAVRKVTTNKGKRTPGIDGVILVSPSSKYEMATNMTNKDYRPLPLKRTYINKPNGKKRPLGIPTIKDRAMQALHQLGLDPIAETVLDECSFGFRKYRGTKDACEYLFKLLSRKNSPKWILEGDIKGMFDNISHGWIQQNIPINKEILRKFLKSGYIYQNKLFKTKSGVVQGGVISPTIANLTMNGLGNLIREKYWKSPTGLIRLNCNKAKVHIVIYADDFIVTADEKETLEDVKTLIEDFLAQRGLQLSKEKTVVTHIDHGFDFLGWNFRRYNEKLIIKPSKISIKRVKANIKEIITKHIGHTQDLLITRLNQVITGWCNYHKHNCAKETFSDIDKYIFECLWHWAKRRHPKKSAGWKKERYFTRVKNRDWVFKSETNQLKYAAYFKIKRYAMIRFNSNPYFPENRGYYLKRRLAKA